MSKEEPAFITNLDDNGGKITFTDSKRFQNWIDKEIDRWKWLIELGDGDDWRNTPSTVQNTLQSIRALSERWERQEIPPEMVRDSVADQYTRDGTVLFHSSGTIGAAILAIRKEFGDEDAALAYGLAARIIGPEVNRPRHMRLLSLVAMPRHIQREAKAAAANESYRGILTEAQRLIAKQNDLYDRTEKEWDKRIGEAEAAGTRSYKRAIWLYAKARRRNRDLASQALESIYETEAAFAEKMRLKAAVDYWAEKKGAHEKAQAESWEVLNAFMIWGGIATLCAFALAIILVLELSGADVVEFIDIAKTGQPSLPTTSYFVVAAGLGAFLTAMFWAARILVRNYTTERYQKGDAEERRIMTMTYLALINSGAIEEEDRLVILNALFRPTPDLFRHDDGPQEIALPAILAKLVDQRGSK